jgi:hypothetical protein
VSERTFDYEGESAVPQPVSQTVKTYLRKSISLSDIISRLLRGWSFSLVGALVGALIGVFVIWITPPSYTVTVTLLPLDAGSADLTGGGGVGFDVLAGLLGSNGPVPKFTRFVASLYSTGVATAMDRRYDAICTAFNCNRKTRVWPKASGLYVWVNRTVTDIAHLPDPQHPKTASDLAKYTEGSVTITSDRNTKMLALSMDDRDPKRASAFLVQLVNTANDYIKEQDNLVVRKQIAYITQQLKTNTDLSQRDALTKMLEEQEQHLMLTAVDLPYVAAIQDGPTVEVSNAAIKFLAAFTLFGFLIGGGLGIALSFLPESKRFWRSPWKKS